MEQRLIEIDYEKKENERKQLAFHQSRRKMSEMMEETEALFQMEKYQNEWLRSFFNGEPEQVVFEEMSLETMRHEHQSLTTFQEDVDLMKKEQQKIERNQEALSREAIKLKEVDEAYGSDGNK